MNVTALDLLLVVSVPLAFAVLGTLLWGLAVRRVRPREQMPSAPPALARAPRSRSAGRLAVQAAPEATAVSPGSRG